MEVIIKGTKYYIILSDDLLDMAKNKVKELENINKKLNLEAQKYYDELIELKLKKIMEKENG